MQLKRVSVGNYKNIADTTLDLNKLVAIVSVNNYGKSNLLEAIRFGFEFISASAKVRSGMMRWERGVPLSTALAGKDYNFSIEFDNPELGEYRFVRYSFSFSWINDQNTGAVITDEMIEMRKTESVQYTSYLKRDKGQYKAAKSKTGFRKISLAKDILAIDILSALDDIGIADVISCIKQLSYRMCTTLEVDSSFFPIPIEIESDNTSSLSFNDNDIPQALSILRKEQPDQYNMFLEAIYDLFPEFKKLELQVYTLKENDLPDFEARLISRKDGESKSSSIPYRIKDEIYRLVIYSEYLNQPISMEFMSTGTKRLIWLIANAVFGNFYGINLIGVDEIETSIHPKMIRGLLESLNDILESASVVVTSHSPYLIQYLKPESIYVGYPSNDGVARFKRIKRNRMKTLLNTTRELELSVGEYLFELMSGDEDSTDVLAAYLGD